MHANIAAAPTPPISATAAFCGDDKNAESVWCDTKRTGSAGPLVIRTSPSLETEMRGSDVSGFFILLVVSRAEPNKGLVRIQNALLKAGRLTRRGGQPAFEETHHLCLLRNSSPSAFRVDSDRLEIDRLRVGSSTCQPL